jgi:ketol-acid reductoisomerase
MTRLFNMDDLNVSSLKDQSIAVLGYGSQGRAQALNLRDSGFNVTVGLRPNGLSWKAAMAEGWSPMEMSEAVKEADVVVMLVPDMVQPEVFNNLVQPWLRSGSLLMFSHGFNVHYDRLVLPESVDVALVAPKAPGDMVRRQYEKGEGVPCLIAVHQNVSGTALDRTLAYAHGLGALRAAVLETSFAEETETDLFGEQAVLCGGATELVVAGWEVLVEAGYSPEVAYFECLHELKLIVDLLYEGGLKRMHRYVSETASYGDVTRGPKVVDEGVRESMRQVLKEIQNGTFSREWVAEHQRGRNDFERLVERDLAHPIEAVGARLRSQMSWLAPAAGGTA